MRRHEDDPTDALEVLGNEIRMGILRELAEAEHALTFTELRERVGIRDTGKFNYHLTKLCSYFVRDTESGYELGHAGSRVIAAGDVEPSSESAAADATDDAKPADTTETCPVCGEGDCGKLFHVHLRAPWR